MEYYARFVFIFRKKMFGKEEPVKEEKKAVRKGRQNPPPEPEPEPTPDVPEADKYINRHNGKPTNSRMILIASDKPKFRESSRKDTERQF